MLPLLTPSAWLGCHHWQRRTDAADPAPEPGPQDWQPRADRGQLLRSERRPDGTLLVEGYAARAGILEYRNADGSLRRELVRADTLARSAVTLGRAPVTLEHPREYVTPDNVSRLGVGDVDGDVVIEDGGFVRIKMAVRRRDAIDAIESGKRELSPGYLARLDETPGVDPEFGPYDAEQIDRIYNHQAIVGRARGGAAVRLRLDCAEPLTRIERRTDAPTDPPPKPPGARMDPRVALLLSLLGDTQRHDSTEDAIETAIRICKSRKDSIDEAVTAEAAKTAEEAKRADAAEALATAEKTRADTAEAKIAEMQAAEQARADAAERSSLEELATSLRVDARPHKTVGDLKRAIATHHAGGTLREDATDAYVDALVDLAREAARADGSGRTAGLEAWAPNEPARRDDGAQSAPTRGLASRWLANLNAARGGEA